MKNILLIAILASAFIACKETKESTIATSQETVTDKQNDIAMNYQSFGDEINDLKVMSQDEMAQKFQNIKAGDSVPVKFKAEVNAVCQAKGCWMKMDMNEEEAMVKFKDYAFFMPKDISGQEIIVEGLAFVEEMSVDEQQHYAEDAGKSKEEIAQITAPKRTLSVLSNGVLIPLEK